MQCWATKLTVSSVPEHVHCTRKIEHCSSELSETLCALAAAFRMRLYRNEKSTASLMICIIIKRKNFSLQYIICVKVTTNGSLRNNVHCRKSTEKVPPLAPAFRNESGQKSNPSCRHGTWWVLHVQPAGKQQRTQLWRVDGLWGSLLITDFRGCFCEKRKKTNIQLILFFAKTKPDLYFAVPK